MCIETIRNDNQKVLRSVLEFASEHMLHSFYRKIVETNDEHMISISSDGKQFSYSRDESTLYDERRRIASRTIGRFVRRILKAEDDIISNRQLELLNEKLMKELFNADSLLEDGEEIAVIKGEEIKKAYLHSRIHSCMVYGRCQDYLDLYADNPDKIEMVVIRDTNSNDVFSRALIWNTDEGVKVLDRVYPNEGRLNQTIHSYAKKQGWLERISDYQESGEDSYHDKHNITLDWQGKYMPYIDSMHYITKDEYTAGAGTIHLSNLSEGWNIISLTGTEGMAEDYSECACCGCVTDDSWYTQDEERICESCYEDHYTRCSYCDGIYHSEQIGNNVEDVCDNCVENHYYQCERCEDYVLNTYTTHDGDCVCESCSEEHYHSCDHCGDLYPEDVQMVETCYGETCPDCLENNFYVCNDCECYTRSTETDSEGNRLCEECADKHYRRCEYCGDLSHEDIELTDTQIGEVCDECIKNNFSKCSSCEEWHAGIEVTDSGIKLCDDCMKNTLHFTCDCCGKETTSQGLCQDCELIVLIPASDNARLRIEI